ncbi:hypothetical protein [Bradyrhizobium sp. 174]|uniref:hypothetical protein n=1 Tax=Bradyrhizobium sp. 174 TaxID=2782645 RepID=UPI001FF7F3F4|nr:hypothetical protein [Bradyrhizobium sp. 174]MCK1577822.1 hypothetical protein [Bradyrhizobium sp. 174]
MHKTLTNSPLYFLANEARKIAFRLQHKAQRYAVAWRYARGCSTRDDGLRLLYDAENIVGIYGLATLNVQCVANAAREIYGDVPGLDDWAGDACSRVNQKYPGDEGAVSGPAEEWALELLVEYAAKDGVTLAEI